MSKYINADELKVTLLNLADGTKEWGEGVQIGFNSCINALDIMPAADVVEVVRCKDCKYNYGIANNCEYAKDDIVCCYWESDGLHSDDFCSKGERKETE